MPCSMDNARGILSLDLRSATGESSLYSIDDYHEGFVCIIVAAVCYSRPCPVIPSGMLSSGTVNRTI